MLAVVSSGHPGLSDWLLLIAAIVFVVAAVLAASTAPRPAWVNAAVLQLVGLALLAVAWLVL